jgi:preprotein translocase subunit SecD
MFTNIVVSRTVLTAMAGGIKPERYLKTKKVNEGREAR